MQIAIIDDERNARLNIKVLLEQYCEDCDIIGEADSVRNSITLLQTIKPDVVLLDVEMLDGTGFDLLDAVSPYNFHLVFITAYESFAIKAFKYNALDYILKPIDFRELKLAMEKARQWKQLEKLDSIIPDPDNESTPARIKLSNSDGTFLLDIDRIIRLESFKNYTTFYITDKPPIVVSKTIGFYDDLLPDSLFHRTHQSHIVNIRHIFKMNRVGNGVVLMSDQSEVPISTRRREEVRKKIKRARPEL
ncbi:MAG: response regulator transcription factor [Saprospiraceae bacterium]|nr:response regulator transcription factor [Saprospiraceae bacterium]